MSENCTSCGEQLFCRDCGRLQHRWHLLTSPSDLPPVGKVVLWQWKDIEGHFWRGYWDSDEQRVMRDSEVEQAKWSFFVAWCVILPFGEGK